MEKIDKMALTVQHIEAICDKIYKPEIILTPIERALVFTILRSKIWSIVDEATPLLPLPKKGRGRQATGKSEKIKSREMEIARAFHNLYDHETHNSESVYMELVKQYFAGEYTDSKRSQIVRDISNGRKHMSEIQEFAAKNVMRCNLSEEQRIKRQEMNKIFFQGMNELEAIKY